MDPHSEQRLPLLVVLMAGGGGTRLWPLSRPEQPKQCLPLLGGRSLFESTVDRLSGSVPLEQIFVVSNRHLEPLLRAAATAIPAENFLCEPSPRNTAPAVAYALARLQARHPKFVMACLPSDHYIADTEAFRRLMQAARTLAEKEFLVTLGIAPTGPVTGYGYIEQGEPLPAVDGFPAFRVRRFTEKPGMELAREMVQSGSYTWNSGMFFWRSDVIDTELLRHQPAIGRAVARLTDAFERKDGGAALEKIWAAMPNLSLDYGVLEKSDRVAVLPARGLGWTDIGSWDALVELYQAHPELRTDVPEGHLDAGSKSVTVIRKTGDDRVLATVGLDDVIIVETDEAILICRAGKSQDVRAIAEMAQKRKSGRKPD
ncbi:MAG: NTP transferase domain-containing protein [Anaerolineales bacterium]|nr:NTP transferase domain-containing protein [Anaerolineales bacterium]